MHLQAQPLAGEQATLRRVATLVAQGARPERVVAAVAEEVAAAVPNAEARDEIARLADEQAALRRVAMLVARDAAAEEVFATVTEELGRLLSVAAAMIRRERDGTATVVARWGDDDEAFPDGALAPRGGGMLTARVFRTGRPARIDGDGASFQHRRRELGIGSAAGAPIRVDGRLWGAMVVAAARPARLPEGIEARIAAFTELVATTLSNLQARAELAASRKRIAEAADAERRRVVRDLHDGAQSRLVHAVIALERLRSREDLPADAQALVADGLLHARSTIHELRELVHGIRPAILTNGGLADAIGVLAQRTPLALDVTIGRERFPGAVESAAYLVVAEALTNVAKHARARRAWVTVAVADDSLVVEVRDDGVGGAADVGPGLVGMHDRVAALDGRLVVTSPPGGGTIVSATIPLRRAPATLPDQTPVVRNRSR